MSPRSPTGGRPLQPSVTNRRLTAGAGRMFVSLAGRPYVSLLLAQCWPMSALPWPCVGLSWPYLAPMLALCWPTLALCWASVRASYVKTPSTCHFSPSRATLLYLTFAYQPKASGKDTGQRPWPGYGDAPCAAKPPPFRGKKRLFF